MKTPVTKQGLRNHFTYSWWKYALLLAVAVFGWNLIYSVTRYRAPENKKVIMNLYTYADQEGLNAYMAEVNASQMPEMEEMYAVYTALDDTYAETIFSVHVAVSEGDIYLLDRAHFQQYASTGVFLPLETDDALMSVLEEGSVSITQGWRAVTETGEQHLFGIPCADLPGMAAYVYNPADCYLTVLANNQNDEYVMRFLNIFVTDMLEAVAPEAAGE